MVVVIGGLSESTMFCMMLDSASNGLRETYLRYLRITR
jgi:hypothetical protein